MTQKKRKSLMCNVLFSNLEEIEAMDSYLKGEGKKFSPWARQILLREIGYLMGRQNRTAPPAPAVIVKNDDTGHQEFQASQPEPRAPIESKPAKPNKAGLLNKFKG